MKKLYCLVMLVLLWLLPGYSQAGLWGCKQAKTISGQTTNGCIKFDKRARKYRLHLPDSYRAVEKKYPLIIGLHGGGGSSKQFEKYSRLSDLSNQSKDFIVVYPQGVDKHWNDGRHNVNSSIDDVQFFKQLVRHLKSELQLRIDDKKIIIIGMSNGGLMAMRVACEQSSWVAGVGVVAASMTTELASTCAKRANPLAMVFVFGDKDTAFLSDGRQVKPFKASQQLGSHIGIGKTVELWAKINRCPGDVVSTYINKDKSDKTHVTHQAYQSCAKPVVFYNVGNGGHRWPDTESTNGRFIVKKLNLGLASHDIDAAKEMLNVFLNSN